MPNGWLARQFAALLHRTGAPVTQSRVIAGVRVDVTNNRADIDTLAVFARAACVLERVRAYQPARYAHLRRDVARIVVERFPCRGAYFSDQRAVLLELTFMVNPEFSDSQVAACLVHEAMHARLDRLGASLGIRPFEAERARHERICRRAELHFGQAVPDGAPVIQRALESLALGDDDVAPDVDWEEANRRTYGSTSM